MEKDIEILEKRDALENLINRVKELEELLEEKTIRLGFENQDNYISKDKIKEKIEELENFKPEEYAPLVIKEEQLNNVKWQIQVLQELLEEEG